MLARLRAPAAIFALAASVYVALLGDRVLVPTEDNHFVHLARSFLHGQLGVVGNVPPGTNDWACFDTQTRGPCPAGRYRFPPELAERYRWYVSFPPLPAVLLLPLVALFDLQTPDRLVWAILAGLGPALLYVLLRTFSERGRSGRTTWQNVGLSLLFAFGTVYFFSAVQGSVWFAAHVVCVPLVVGYLLFALDARRPWLAGLMLGLAFMTRASTFPLALFFLVEALRVARAENGPPPPEGRSPLLRAAVWLRAVRPAALLRPLVAFAVPILVIGAVAMAMNHARFGDPFEFGHRFLSVRWADRIERWGLFNYHYLAKNLAVFTSSLPWLSARPPYLTISRHGLALWFTTPNLLWVLWPRRVDATAVGLMLAAGATCLLDLCYQNSGWIQFGYRFALDYMPLLFALLALGGRRFGSGFWGLAAFAVLVNAFGAITFDRVPRFYDTDPTQNVIFQPD
ncbi:MAG: hypothetical protein NZ898_02000 [Myxococcota bacterium]|nr:hypothetical protein [Myxococcota bacterium]MDW8361582.1 hypothetical protein [Myxococcales bacterium]